MNIGIIDSGIDPSVCALKDALEAFYHINDEGEGTKKIAHDPSGHGTFNAAILAGKSTQGPAPMLLDPRLYIAAAIEGQALVIKALEAMEWMMNQPIDILLMPFGIKGNSPVFAQHLQAFLDKGVLPIVAIGNEGAGKFRSPGCYSTVLSVGACDLDGNVASFSGSVNIKDSPVCIKPDFVTLGVDVESPYKKIGTQKGSSMAATITAGHIANLWQQNPSLNNHQVARLVCESAQSLKVGQVHRSKYGVFDMKKAKQLVKRGKHDKTSFLTAVQYDRYIDPYLKTKCTIFNEKSVDFIVALAAGYTLENLIERFPQIKIKKKYCQNQLAWAHATTDVTLRLMEAQEIKLLQATNVPFLSLD